MLMFHLSRHEFILDEGIVGRRPVWGPVVLAIWILCLEQRISYYVPLLCPLLCPLRLVLLRLRFLRPRRLLHACRL